MLKYVSLAAIAAFAAVGCNHSPEGGTPNTSSSFTISAPTLTTTIKQDNKESIKLTLNRGSGFKQAVKMSAAAPDSKIKVEFNKDVVAPSDSSDVVMTVSAAKDAPLGDLVIKVTGTPEGGTPASVDVKIKIEKNP